MRKYIFSLPGIFLLLRLRLGIISKLHRFTLEYLSLAKVNATFIFVYLVKVDFVPMALSDDIIMPPRPVKSAGFEPAPIFEQKIPPRKALIWYNYTQ
jgi:hypothetical protein